MPSTLVAQATAAIAEVGAAAPACTPTAAARGLELEHDLCRVLVLVHALGLQQCESLCARILGSLLGWRRRGRRLDVFADEPRQHRCCFADGIVTGGGPEPGRFGTVSANSWALPLLGILVLTLLLPGLVLLISGRSLSEALGGSGPRRSLSPPTFHRYRKASERHDGHACLRTPRADDLHGSDPVRSPPSPLRLRRWRRQPGVGHQASGWSSSARSW